MILKPFHEVVGTLTEAEVKDGITVLVFRTEHVIEIPSEEISHDQLDQIKGKQIGIFNNSSEYLIREIKTKVRKENIERI